MINNNGNNNGTIMNNNGTVNNNGTGNNNGNGDNNGGGNNNTGGGATGLKAIGIAAILSMAIVAASF